MITAIILSAISLLLLGWLTFEIIIANRLSSSGSRITATVVGAQQYSDGDRQVELEINDGNTHKQLCLGYMSSRFMKLKPGDTLKIIYHPNVNFVIPDSFGGIITRPIIAATLFLVCLIVAIPFDIPLFIK
jgi:hypothetical protein